MFRLPLAHPIPSHPANTLLWPAVHEWKLLTPRHDETWVSGSPRKLEEPPWSRLSHSAGGGWRRSDRTPSQNMVSNAADWWHLMMCKICNGALVLTDPSWTLGPLKPIPISSSCWPCVIADLHDHLVRPHALNFFLCFAFMLLHRATAQSELKYRLFASHSNVTQGAGNFFLRSLKFQWRKEFCPMEAQFGQVIKEPKDQLMPPCGFIQVS